ncbi:Siderophore synthetase component [Actinomadura meyerae]|uniref:Siderophore synthetase component n=1 Tax=Actinomadura meyerae TaxID=240840 RepID=A0A239HM25_9ACTN|nr:IucA/IucC family protein [Actinomadura meyerae]SNS82128.1 Siderophore synthetase component [Actinomadura meyerae]
MTDRAEAAPPPDRGEGALAARVLDALLREDYGGMRRLVRDGRLELPGRSVRLLRARPVFLSELVVAPGQDLKLSDVFRAVRSVADPRDDTAAFERECRAALAAGKLLDDARPAVLRRLAHLPDALRTGPGTFYESLAAYNDHPVHPAGRSRAGLSMAGLSRYAPEFAPSFPLRWAPVRNPVLAGRRPEWWPAPSDVGLRSEAGALFPVHPLAVRRVREEAGTAPAPEPFLRVGPTLSMRTVAVLGGAAPPVHVKMPLPTSTLGLRNRRTIMPGTLHDGALVERILRRVLQREPALPVFLADEQTYGHANDPLLAYLVRRFPPETARAHVVPVAALLAEAPEGGYVIERWDVEKLFGAYLSALFEWNVTLFRYGIALEAHQQNVALVLDDTSPLRLLIKDNDGALIDPSRLGERLAPSPGADPRDLIDRRMTTADPDALARVFVTITLHLCAAAVAVGLADRGLLPWRTGLAMVRERLDGALGPADAFLRSRTLDAASLPGKAMLTAGTLVDKARTGAADINKHYGPPGPNYLLDATCR